MNTRHGISNVSMIARTLLSSLMLLGAGCDGSAPTVAAPATQAGAMAESHGDAVVRVGDVDIRASVVQTSVLPESVARLYGLDRDPKTVLLLVSVRKGDPADAVALPARVSATATDLRGGRQDIPMHQVHTDALIDVIGTTPTTLPDTLRFEVTVDVAGMAPVHLQLEREFYPQ